MNEAFQGSNRNREQDGSLQREPGDTLSRREIDKLFREVRTVLAHSPDWPPPPATQPETVADELRRWEAECEQIHVAVQIVFSRRREQARIEAAALRRYYRERLARLEGRS